MSNPSADIAADQVAVVRLILTRSLPAGCQAWIFGSRSRGTSRTVSDLDLAIDIGRALSRGERLALAEAFDESPLPFRVDVVDLRSITDRFRTAILADLTPLPD